MNMNDASNDEACWGEFFIITFIWFDFGMADGKAGGKKNIQKKQKKQHTNHQEKKEN